MSSPLGGVRKAVPVRTCLGCRERAAAATMSRVAWDGAQQRVVWDVPRRLGGRGAWLHPRADCVAAALRRKAVGRALRRTLTPAHTDRLAGELGHQGCRVGPTGA